MLPADIEILALFKPALEAPEFRIMIAAGQLLETTPLDTRAIARLGIAEALVILVFGAGSDFQHQG